MSSKPVELLPDADPLDGSELIHVVQNGSSRKVAASQLGAGGGDPGGGTGGGGFAGWYNGLAVPTLADLPTLLKERVAGTAIVIAEDADLGLVMDSQDLVGDCWKGAYRNWPGDGADWTATGHFWPGLTRSDATEQVGLMLAEVNASNASFPLNLTFGPVTSGDGPWLRVRIDLASGITFVRTAGELALHNTNDPIWLRIRYVAAETKYYFEYSFDGKQWRLLVAQTKAQIGFIVGANAIGVGFFVSNNNAAGRKATAVCDYFDVNGGGPSGGGGGGVVQGF